jgi:phosphoglycerate dehydrogenase-like enzyme
VSGSPDARTSVLVVGASAGDPPPGMTATADAVEVTYAETADAVGDAIGHADVIFAWRARRELLEDAWPRRTRLRWIQTASAGVDSLLFPALVDSDVVLTNARGIFDDAIAEWAIGMMAVFAKGVLGVIERQRRHEWRHELTEPLAGRNLLVVGVGGIGRAIGRNARALGLDVLGVGRTARAGDDVFRAIVGADELAEVLPWADVVVDVLPATPQTRRVFDAAAFAAMRPGARFLNVGRGWTVDETALVGALRDRRIAGAALDVFEEEPLADDSPLWDLPNVVVSPHMSGDFAGWHEAVVELFLQNLLRFVRGERLRGVVDKRLGYAAGP